MTGPLEPRDGWVASGCTIAKSLDLSSTKSAFLLMREAFYGATRFEDFVARAGISEPSAAARLRDLVAAGLLERCDYRDPGQRTRPGTHSPRRAPSCFPLSSPSCSGAIGGHRGGAWTGLVPAPRLRCLGPRRTALWCRPPCQGRRRSRPGHDDPSALGRPRATTTPDVQPPRAGSRVHGSGVLLLTSLSSARTTLRARRRSGSTRSSPQDTIRSG